MAQTNEDRAYCHEYPGRKFGWNFSTLTAVKKNARLPFFRRKTLAVTGVS